MSELAEKLKELREKATPGPWRWELNAKHKNVQLCGGRPTYDVTVMDFTRWGMGGAAPRFKNPTHPHKVLERADAFAKPVEGREHHASWFQTVDHPDAEIITLLVNNLDTIIAALSEGMGWREIETAPKDETVLVTVVPTEANEAFLQWKPTTHPAYIDDEGRICDAGSWKPEPGLDGKMWRTTHWQPLPAPPALSKGEEEERNV